jgi:hypothetical protein
MTMAQSNTQKLPINVISLFGARPEMEEDEVAVGIEAEQTVGPRPAPEVVNSRLDLTGKSKVWFIIGRGKTGKTTLLRFAAEEAAAAERRVLLVDLDRANATLASYFQGVQRPPAGDEAGVTAWLEKLLTFIMTEKAAALIDLGGGDTTLRRLVSEVPDLVATLETAGVAAVAIYMLGPQPDDLAPLATLEAAGFQPAATLLVLNEGLIETPVSREEAFARVLRHSVFKAAAGRGAEVVWMPRLLPAGEIEARRVLFGQAERGVVREGRKQTPLGPFDQARVRAWLRAMRAEFAGVGSWMS